MQNKKRVVLGSFFVSEKIKEEVEGMNKRLNIIKSQSNTHKKKNHETKIQRRLPVYDLKGKNRTPEKEEKKKRISIGIIVASCVLIFLYAPQLFMKEDGVELKKTNVATLDRTATRTINTVLRSNGELDYDGDKLSNADEVTIGTNPWLVDTDGDGATDYCEKYISKTDPLKSTKIMVDYQTKQDSSNDAKLATPYKMNNCILWADSYLVKSRAGVVELDRSSYSCMAAYRFVGFAGYVQFPIKGIPYKVENGHHILLQYDNKNDAYRIDKSCDVELYEQKLREMKAFLFFGRTYYIERNKVLDILDFILPDRGFVGMYGVVDVDAQPDTAKATTTDIVKPAYDLEDPTRFTQNTNTLNDLLFVKKSIKEGKTVAVSLFHESEGEFVGLAYGYDAKGNLLIADSDKLSSFGTLYIAEKAVKMLDEAGNIVLVSSFDWSGFGVSSDKGYKISFFAVENEKKEKPLLSNSKRNQEKKKEEKKKIQEDIDVSH